MVWLSRAKLALPLPQIEAIADIRFVLSRLRHRCGEGINGDPQAFVSAPVTKMGLYSNGER